MGVLNEMLSVASSAAATDRTGGRVNLLRMMSAYEIVLERHGLAPIEDTRFYQLLLNLSMMPESDWSEKLAAMWPVPAHAARIHSGSVARRVRAARRAPRRLRRWRPRRPAAERRRLGRRLARRAGEPAAAVARHAAASGGADERSDVADAAARGERGDPARRGGTRRARRGRRRPPATSRAARSPGGEVGGGGRDLDGRHRRAPAPHTTLRRLPDARLLLGLRRGAPRAAAAAVGVRQLRRVAVGAPRVARRRLALRADRAAAAVPVQLGRRYDERAGHDGVAVLRRRRAVLPPRRRRVLRVGGRRGGGARGSSNGNGGRRRRALADACACVAAARRAAVRPAADGPARGRRVREIPRGRRDLPRVARRGDGGRRRAGRVRRCCQAMAPRRPVLGGEADAPRVAQARRRRPFPPRPPLPLSPVLAASTAAPRLTPSPPPTSAQLA